MFDFLGKLLDSNEKEIAKLKPVVDSVNALEKKTTKLTDKQLRGKLAEFRSQYQKGKTLEDLLPEVFAVVRESAGRSVKMRHFDVQLMAAAILHQGKVAEQKTGEGKTMSAVPALFLNAITGKGVQLVTVNDYLAMRDAGWMGPIYHALGATVGVIAHDSAFIYDPRHKDNTHDDKRLQHLKPVSRKEAYQADITYGTNNEFGFDYLRDNMARTIDSQFQRDHYFAVVDEVDSILIDEARTPLIISAPAQEPTEKYVKFKAVIDKLSAETDYVVDEKAKTANLTEHGILKIEKILGVENLYEKDFTIVHHIEEALKARTLFFKDRDYVVKDGEVVIVDQNTGRLMFGRRYSEGLHQAIEAKEGVEVQQESQTLATISLQNYFRLYEKLAGMTGTAVTEAEELNKIYKLEVVVIPTNQPMVRTDHPDTIYKTQTAKYTAVADLIAQLYEKGQPVLVGTTSIDKNEFLSELLKRKGISHALLNAKNHEKEAEIISLAGQKGAVTVATNMAGRGVDIKLDKGIDKLGGLYVVGTERHESRRIDNQLRGRSGRQGDPGETRFFVSLEDDLMRIFGGEQVSKVMDALKMPEDTPIEHAMVSRAIESAQKKVEGHYFDIRKNTVEYDDVMNQQREIIYGIRKQILETAAYGGDALKNQILEKIERELLSVATIHSEDGIDSKKIIQEFSTIVPIDLQSTKEIEKQLSVLTSAEQVGDFLFNLAKNWYEQREKGVGEKVARDMEVFVYLSIIDTLWIEHLDTVDDLRSGIGLRSFAQRDPLVEYKKEAFELFERLIATIDYEVVHQIYKVAVQGQQPISNQPLEGIEVRPELDISLEQETSDPRPSSVDDNSVTKVKIERDGEVISEQVLDESGSMHRKKIGRNDPCWCGSGKKYKKCHYPN